MGKYDYSKLQPSFYTNGENFEEQVFQELISEVISAKKKKKLFYAIFGLGLVLFCAFFTRMEAVYSFVGCVTVAYIVMLPHNIRIRRLLNRLGISGDEHNKVLLRHKKDLRS